MSDTFKLQYNGMTLTYPGWNGYVSYDAPAFKTLTLYNSEGGTLTANKLTGYPGDTINLSTAYDTYWRFSGYQLTGDGSLVGNDYTFGNEDASICACYKKNAFTATGGFEKGSNVSVTANQKHNNSTNIIKYATINAHTGDIPTSWYSTSNRWKPNDASAYSLTMNGKLNLTGKGVGYNAVGGDVRGYARATGCMFVNTEISNSQSWSCGGHPASVDSFNGSYNKTLTTTKQNVNYGVSARINAQGFIVGNHKMSATATYVANGTNGSWTATGYAP